MYSVSSDGYLGDLSINATPSGGMPVEMVPGPFGFGSGVQLYRDNENCLYCTSLNNGPQANCFNDLSNCTDEGLSLSIWVNIAFDVKDKSSKYIISTGGDTEGVPGLAIYYQGVDLHAVVSNGSHYWYVYALGPIPNCTWSNVGLRWDKKVGWEMYVDQERVAKVVYPTPTKGPVKKAINPPAMSIGCHVVGDPLRFQNYSEGKFDEVAVWFRQLNDSQLNYFSGGYDAQAANMSVDDVAIIVTQKLNLTDPEEHQQAVDILTKMSDSIALPSDDDDTTTISTPPTTAVTESQTTQNITHTTTTATNIYNPNQHSYVAPAETQPRTTDNEQKMNKMSTISRILGEMIKPSSIKSNMTVQEMGSFQNTLKIYSSILDPNNQNRWNQLQKNGNGSIAMVQSILQWGIDLTKNTWLKYRSQSFQYTKATENIVLTTQRLTVKEYNDGKGLLLPNYYDSEWDQVRWREGTSKVPLDSCTLPRELCTGIGRSPNSELLITNGVFNSLTELAPVTVNENNLPSSNMIIDSKIIAVLMDPKIGFDYSLYYHPIRVTLAHVNKEPALTRKLLFHDESRRIPTIKNRYCVSWNPSVKPNGGWDSSGCEMYHTSDQYSVCDCDHMGAYAILAQNIERRVIYPDPDWLMYLKYAFYGLSAGCLLFYMIVIIISRHLKDQFHIIRLCTSLAVLSGSASMFTTDFVRGDRHSCTIVTGVLHYSYVAVASWLLMESHALFGTMMHGIVGGKLKAYFPFAWGCPMLCVGVAILSDFKDYGMEPRCIVSWNDNLKWTLFAPVLIFGAFALGLTSATILNTSFAAVKKEIVFEDVSSVAWGLLIVTVTFSLNWIFACLAYLDIEYMSPDFYPIFQVLNAGMGFLVFIFMGLGSKRFRIVLSGKVPDSRHLPSFNQKSNNLVPVKPQPKH
ncbi:LATrophilin [Chamberlinius hualienensis]